MQKVVVASMLVAVTGFVPMRAPQRVRVLVRSAVEEKEEVKFDPATLPKPVGVCAVYTCMACIRRNYCLGSCRRARAWGREGACISVVGVHSHVR